MAMAFSDTRLKAADIPVGDARCITLAEIKVGLFRTVDGFFAINNECPHRGAPLHDGFVTEGKVTCPWHQWDFDLKDGHCRNIPKVRTASYPVEVREGILWIQLHDQGAKKL